MVVSGWKALLALVMGVKLHNIQWAEYFQFLVKPRTHLSMHRSAPHRTAPNYLGASVWAAQTTWGICSKHAHALCEPDLIVVGPSEWALFCTCSVWTAFLPFWLPRRQTGVFYVTLNKILLSSAHIGSAMYVPHVHTFAVISRLAPHHIIWCGADLCMLKCVPHFKCNLVGLWGLDCVMTGVRVSKTA